MGFSNKHNSARRVAFARSWESHKPAGERVCFDPFAKDFLNWTGKFFSANPLGRKLATRTAAPIELGILGYVPLRTRVIDEFTLDCVKNGMDQLVIMGAGYDSRAYRMDELKQLKKIFEVDLGRNQDDKLARLGKMLGAVPQHVTYVPVDFESGTLNDALLQSGYSPDLKTLFIWEGVASYLELKSVDQTLAFMASRSAPGSAVIFDYLHEEVLNGASVAPLAKDLLDYGVGIGEPWKTGINPDSIEEFLAARGFSQVNNFSTEQCKQMYWPKHQQDKDVLKLFSIVQATTGSGEDAV